MPLANPCRNLFHLGSNADVARLGLPADLLRDALELLAPAREEHTAPPTCGERARHGRADPARSPCDDGDAHGATIDSPPPWLTSPASEVWFSASRTAARSRGRSRRSWPQAEPRSPSRTKGSGSRRA